MARPLIINYSPATVGINEHFIIQLDEEPFQNCLWEVTPPPNVQLINTNRSFRSSIDIRTWEFVILTSGTHQLEFRYRKQCCNHRVMKSVVYTITTM
ncbi:MAG: protease inhibitor I42 family protein [Cellulosilyticaceae bacterium]